MFIFLYWYVFLNDNRDIGQFKKWRVSVWVFALYLEDCMNEPFNPELENDKIISTGNPAFNEQNSSDENIEVLETLESAPSEKKI